MRVLTVILFAAAAAALVAGCEGSAVPDGCAYLAGEITPAEYDAGVRCDGGLVEIPPAHFHYPCAPEGATCQDGCSVPPPYQGPWVQCSPCGNGICECAFGENRCNCPDDCE